MLDIKWIIFLSFSLDELTFNIKLKSKLVFFSLQNVNIFILKNVETKCSDILENPSPPIPISLPKTYHECAIHKNNLISSFGTVSYNLM